MASEVCEEIDYKTNASSPSEPSEASTWRRRDLVSMVTFRLTMVEFIRQNRAELSAIRVMVTAVSCDECGAIPWDEFQVQKNGFRHFFSLSLSRNYTLQYIASRKTEKVRKKNQTIHKVIKESPNTSKQTNLIAFELYIQLPYNTNYYLLFILFLLNV